MRQFRRLVDPLQASLIAVENGEGRTAETLALLEALGVEDGWPDLMLVMCGGRVHFLEVKLDKTERHARTDLRDSQRRIHALLRWYGHPVDTIRSAAELWAVVDTHGIPHKPLPDRPLQLTLPRPRRRRVRVAA